MEKLNGKKYSDFQTSMQAAEKYKNALIYMLSEVNLVDEKHRDEVNNISEKEIIEARFFDESGEVHIFRKSGKIVGYELIEENIEDAIEFVDSKKILTSAFSGYGNQLTVRKYFDYDEDGQIRCVLTRLVKLEKGVE